MFTPTRRCPICGGAGYELLSLAPTPLGDSLAQSVDEALTRQVYPLDLVSCDACCHLFLRHAVTASESYEDYHFSSGASPGLGQEMEVVARRLIGRGELRPTDLVLDVGSNDGTWLSHFQSRGLEVVGIEPSARAGKFANDRGIRTIQGYFPESVPALGEVGSNIRLVSANFVFANLEDPHAFLAAARELVGPGGLLSIMTGYHPDQFEVNMFDFIYHEHLSYYSVRDFVHLAAEHGLSVESADRINLKGGALHVVLRVPECGDSATVGDSVRRLLQYESWRKIADSSYRDELRRKLDRLRTRWQEVWIENSVEKLVGYGMSHSVTTLSYDFGIVPSLAHLVDDNPSRWNLFAPGSALEICSPLSLETQPADAIVILAWQHDYLILEKLSKVGWKGLVFQPLPHPSIYSLGDL